MSREIIVKQAVVHILDANIGMPVLSNKGLDLGVEIHQFLVKLIQKVFDDDSAKEVYFFNPENKIKQIAETLKADAAEFMILSQDIAAQLYELMTHHVSIPSADLICCLFDDLENSYLGVLKLNYKTNFIHFVESEAEANVVSLVKQQTVLPSENQRPEEGFLINLTDFSLKLIEKEYEIDGEKTRYLSKIFLECSDQLSNREKAKVIDKVAQRISKKYGTDDFTASARLRKAVTENLEETNCIEVNQLAEAVFQGNPGAQREYVEEIQKAGIVEPEIYLSEKIAEKKFRNQKIQTDTGVELNFPADYFNNNDKIEFINNPDGTISILIKNVSKIMNK